MHTNQSRTWMIVGSLLLAGAASAAPAGPAVLPFEETPDGLTVRVMIGGSERRMLLALESPVSYLRNAPDGSAEVEAGGVSLGRARFAEPGPGQAGSVDGALGRDLLQGMAVGFDQFRHEYAFWPRSTTPASAEAEAWAVGLPAWDGPSKVRRLKIGAFPDGAPSVDLSVGGKRVPALVSIGSLDTNVAPSVAATDALLPDGRAVFASASVGGLIVPWLLCRRHEPGRNLQAVVGMNALGARRVLVDLKAGTVYVEELPEAASLSKFLDVFTRASVDLRGDILVVQVPPGADPTREAAIARFQGLSIVRIADTATKDWIDALRGRDDAGAKALVALLAKTLGAFSMDIQTPVGERSIRFTG